MFTWTDLPFVLLYWHFNLQKVLKCRLGSRKIYRLKTEVLSVTRLWHTLKWRILRKIYSGNSCVSFSNMFLQSGILSIGVFKTQGGLGLVSPPRFFRALWSRVHRNSALSIRCYEASMTSIQADDDICCCTQKSTEWNSNQYFSHWKASVSSLKLILLLSWMFYLWAIEIFFKPHK